LPSGAPENVIVRKQSNDELILIGQTDHSRLVGQLAAHWGNETFAVPQPYTSMVRAATFHDYGWLRYETSPLTHPETGEPYQFLQVPLGTTQLEAYQWSLDWLAGIDKYSGLIINMHRTGLWKNRYGTIAHPGGYNLRELSPEVGQFIERNEAWQERERASWDRDALWTNYKLMQVWDLLGLYFCCHEPYEDYVEPVPVRYSGHSETRLTMTPLGPYHVKVDPYPFNKRPCNIQLSFKRLPTSSFENVEGFHRMYFQAENDLMRFELL
jgi:Protein of unknown function (DUF3891)